ncbi:MAG: KpsF/GutQ family sugar-phosphate isomerase [Candidatus Latescibacterota bacterium]|nr:MAG: KpsF/GutQ family sugar-phosphate isomerase [Candidatus Latescibacterota bacterium]
MKTKSRQVVKNRKKPNSKSGKKTNNHDPKRQDLDIAKNVFRDEIEGLKRVSEQIDDSFHKAVDVIYRCRGRLIIFGVGKSGLIAKKIAATLTSTGTPSFYLHPVEAAHGDLGLVTGDDVVFFLSKSGMSDELRPLLPTLRRLGVTIIAMTGNAKSFLAEHSDIVLNTQVDHEACGLDLAPTTSTTAALVMGDALASALIKRRHFRPEDFARFHPSGILGKRLTLRVSELMRTGDAVPLVTHDTALKDALFEMMDKAVGCVGVVDDGGKLYGIITDGDLKRILVRNPNAMDAPVETVMTRDPKTIGEEVLAAAALNRMELNASGPLTMFFITDDDGKPTGILHIHDILKAGLSVE